MNSTAFALESGMSETGLSYNEIGIAYASSTTNSGNNTGTAEGASVGAQTLLNKNIFIFGNYSMPSGTFNGLGNVDISAYQAGLGVRSAIASNIDITASATYLNSKSSFLGLSPIYIGYATSVGARALVAPKLEANFSVSYYDTKNDTFGTNSGTQYRIGTGYQLSEKFIGRASYVTETGKHGYSVGLSYLF